MSGKDMISKQYKSKKTSVKKSDKKEIESKIYLDSHIVTSIYDKKNVLLIGKVGSGKTHSVLHIFQDMKNKNLIDEVIELTFVTGMDDYDLLSKFSPSVDGKLKIIDGQIEKAFRLASEGKRVAVLLDELTRIPAKSLNILISILDKVRNKYVLNNFIKGEVVECQTQNLFFVATANLGRNFEGTFNLDEAILDRFEKITYVDYSTELEYDLIKQKFPKITSNQMLEITSEIQTLRQGSKENLFESPFSTRLLKYVLSDMLTPTRTEFKRVVMESVIYRLLPKNLDGSPMMGNLELIYGIENDK